MLENFSTILSEFPQFISVLFSVLTEFMLNGVGIYIMMTFILCIIIGLFIMIIRLVSERR